MMGTMWLFMLFTVVVIGIVIVAGDILLVRWLETNRGEKRKNAPGDDAETILQERLARGEIDANEYQERLKTLHNAK